MSIVEQKPVKYRVHLCCEALNLTCVMRSPFSYVRGTEFWFLGVLYKVVFCSEILINE